jgi:hypothetical protein
VEIGIGKETKVIREIVGLATIDMPPFRFANDGLTFVSFLVVHKSCLCRCVTSVMVGYVSPQSKVRQFPKPGFLQKPGF